MRRIAGLLICGVSISSQIASAYEYTLQFTPNSGAGGLVVAGYSQNGNTVLGNCSYYTVQGGSGKGGGYHTTTTYYNQTCAWDLYGNLLSVTPGAPVVPAPLAISGTETIYSANTAGEYTGTDTKLPNHGFVNTPGSHYGWLTPNTYALLNRMAYTFNVTLLSDGDVPLNISDVQATVLNGKVTVNRGTCIGQIQIGATCSAVVTYDPTALRSPTGLVYDTLDLSVISDAGQASPFVQSCTITLKTKSDGD